MENAKLLLEHGADANAKDRYGQGMIIAAISFSNEDMVKLLLQHGANCEIGSKEGRKELWYASAFMKKPEIANLLFSNSVGKYIRKLMGENAADGFLSSFLECVGK